MAGAEKTTLFRDLSFIVSCDDEDRVYQNASLLVCGNSIKCVAEETGSLHGNKPEMPVADEVIDCGGMVLYPGLINTHHHLYQTFSRNLPEVQGLQLFAWLKKLYEIWKNLDEEVIYYSAMTGLSELLLGGCTTCMDHHYVFPKGCQGNLLAEQFRAADTLGIRFHATRGSMDLSVKDGGLPPDAVVQSVDEILKDCEDAVSRFHDAKRFSMHRVLLAPCSPFSVSEDLLRESARLARSLGVRLHTHLAETKDEENYTLSRYGIRPLAYMERLDWLGEDVHFAHGIHFNDDEIALLAQTKTGVAHCPASNMKLSSGVARIPDLLEQGVPVGLAVDGSASNDASSLMEEMRTAYLLHRLTYGDRAPDGYEILKMATRGSARILGRDDIGCIAPGMAADFFLVDLKDIALCGAQFDVKSMLSTVGLRRNADMTVVNGRIVVRNRKLVTVDEADLVSRAEDVQRNYILATSSCVTS